MTHTTHPNPRPDARRDRARRAGGLLRRLAVLAAFWVAVGAAPGRAVAAASKEYQVKAACLLNFAQFIEWPASAFPEAGTPIAIGVLGDDPFGQVLEQTVEGETVQNRKLVIRRSRKVEDLKACHILFVSRSEKERVAQVLGELKGTTVVTVGEMEDFARDGGIINFFLDGNKVRFEINPDAAKRNGLKISSQLLKLARIVGASS